MKLKFFFFVLVLNFLIPFVHAQNLAVADTFTYTINLDLSQNLYLKTVPQDLLKGYCKGYWKAYYPAREMNECLFDDFLQRFNYGQMSVETNSLFCYDDYCNDAYFKDMYGQFTRKLKYKEVVWFDPKHSIVKREVLWVQLYYSEQEYDVWKHYNGPVFWLKEIRQSAEDIQVYNKNVRSVSWSLDKEFMFPGFIINENKQKDQQKKLEKYDKAEEY